MFRCGLQAHSTVGGRTGRVEAAFLTCPASHPYTKNFVYFVYFVVKKPLEQMGFCPMGERLPARPAHLLRVPVKVVFVAYI
jgi:hypothetical protein